MSKSAMEANMIAAPFVTGLRWLVFFPVSLICGFLVGAAFHGIFSALGGADGGLWPPIGYAIAFCSGLIHVGLALLVAHTIAPSFKLAVIAVLGFFLLGDMIFAHLILPNMVAQGNVSSTLESDIGLILGALRADDYVQLTHGGLAKISGAVVASFLIWRKFISRASTPALFSWYGHS